MPIGALAAALAYVGGVLTKPLQDFILDRRDRTRLRKTLYSELAGNYDSIFKLRDWLQRKEGNDIVDPSLFTSAQINLDGFDYARKQPILFHSLNEAHDLKALYGSFTLLRQAKDESREELFRSIHSLFDGLTQRVQEGHLDRELFLSFVSQPTLEYFDALTFNGTESKRKVS